MIEDFGMRLKRLRVQRGISQVQLANRLEVNTSTISAYENNISSPSARTLIRLSQIFGVSTDYLLGLDESLYINVSGITEDQRLALEILVKGLRKTKGDSSNR